MNCDKIRFNHLPKGTVRIDPVPSTIDFYIGPKTYIAVSSNTGLVKIGRSTHYEDRIRAIEAKAKDVLLVVSVFNDDRELKLHRRFNEQRVVGEWFRLSMDEVEQLRSEGHIQ
jgi:hypothetical protein